MKRIFILIFISAVLLSSGLSAAATVNGRFKVVSHDSKQYTIKLQINTNTGSSTLGCSTIIFNYDSSLISFPSSPAADKDYSFLNFSGSNYRSTVTRPLPDQIWINIESLSSAGGTEVAGDPGWTDVIELTFKVLKDSGSAGLSWQTKDGNWAIYDINNADTWNNGTWRDTTIALKTNKITSTGISNPLPDKFKMYQNYPNPFNPSTTIKYTVPKYSHVSLKVYDITGKEVKTLVNGERSPGTYAVNFNAENLSSGMYIYRIMSGNYTEVKKMILLK